MRCRAGGLETDIDTGGGEEGWEDLVRLQKSSWEQEASAEAAEDGFAAEGEEQKVTTTGRWLLRRQGEKMRDTQSRRLEEFVREEIDEAERRLLGPHETDETQREGSSSRPPRPRFCRSLAEEGEETKLESDRQGGVTDKVSPEEAEIVARQIGRKPLGLLYVARYSSNGLPQVVAVSPVVRNQPFPTQLWLTDQALCERISVIEGAGNIQKLQAEISADERMQRQVVEDNLRYIRFRWNLVRREMLLALRNRSATVDGCLKRRGVGGLSDFCTVKCLHMHYAFHLVKGCEIGRWMDKHFLLHLHI